MTLMLQILGCVLLGWIAFYCALMAVAFCIGFSQAAKKSKRRQRRRAPKQLKSAEVKPTLRVVWPE